MSLDTHVTATGRFMLHLLGEAPANFMHVVVLHFETHSNHESSLKSQVDATPSHAFSVSVVLVGGSVTLCNDVIIDSVSRPQGASEVARL